MKQGKQSGFTIVEVLLFLAISALLVMIAMSAMTGSIRNAKFSDATKSLESFLEAQFTAVQTGSFDANASAQQPVCSSGGIAGYPRGSAEANNGKGSCLIMGRAIDFSDTSLSVYPVLGFAGSDTSSSSVFEALAKANPRIWQGSGVIDSYTLGWQTKIDVRKSVNVASLVAGNQSSPVNRLLFLRGINTEAVNMYAASDTSQPITSLLSLADAKNSPSNTRNVPTLLCVKSEDFNNLRGYVQLNGTGTGNGFSIGSIESTISSPGENVFAGVTPRAGYGGISCQP